jgi:uncharacterized protein (TIGR02246 family)
MTYKKRYIAGGAVLLGSLRRFHHPILHGVLLLMIASGGLAISRGAAESSDEASLHEILRMQTEAWNHGDGVAWAKEFTDDCDFVNLRGGTLHGRTDLGAQITAILQGRFKASHLSLSVRRFSLLTADAALIETDYEITGLRDPIPGFPATAHGVLKTRMQYVAVKRDKHWHFVAAQNTAVLPPPQP